MTDIFPVTAVAGTVTTISVAVLDTIGAMTVPILTCVTPLKLVPTIVTNSPTVPDVGVNELIFGVTLKTDVLGDEVPAGELAVMDPVVAPSGTITLIDELDTITGGLVVGMPLKRTSVTLERLTPLIVTNVPTGPDSGVKEVIFGFRVKLVALVAVPLGVVIDIGPDVAVTGTVAPMEVSDVIVNVADTVLNFTDVAPLKLVPVIVIASPALPDVGVKESIFGLTLKLVALNAVPVDVVTDILPV